MLPSTKALELFLKFQNLSFYAYHLQNELTELLQNRVVNSILPD